MFHAPQSTPFSIAKVVSITFLSLGSKRVNISVVNGQMAASMRSKSCPGQLTIQSTFFGFALPKRETKLIFKSFSRHMLADFTVVASVHILTTRP